MMETLVRNAEASLPREPACHGLINYNYHYQSFCALQISNLWFCDLRTQALLPGLKLLQVRKYKLFLLTK
jgi:hypothetical protein